ncbi:MAG: hypothetical protein WCO00_16990 [Rhodospirillaceae bacterium]
MANHVNTAGLLSCVASAVFLSACAGGHDPVMSSDVPDIKRPEYMAPTEYPMKDCQGKENKSCVVRLFDKGTDVSWHDVKKFPHRYLELYDRKAILDFCKPPNGGPACEARLNRLSNYFNPNGRPGDGEIGVALEGGGTKAASFSMGALAGLERLGLFDGRVTAVSSASGGSYAAGYLFNRWYDRLRQFKKNPAADMPGPGGWFESCIPSKEPYLYRLKDILNVGTHSCSGKRASFIDHVWRNRDIINGTLDGDADDEWLSWKDAWHVLFLVTETAATMPVDLATRAVFRWPSYTAPSEVVYKSGLERDYGFSPSDWQEEIKTPYPFRIFDMQGERREERTFGAFKMYLDHASDEKQKWNVPLWIVNTTAPGRISVDTWMVAQPRDPLRQEFELTMNGYGSGIYGYALSPPPSSGKWLGANPSSMPLVDAIATSGAFADKDETLLANPIQRIGAGAILGLVNTEWFTEIPNFNTSDLYRFAAEALPWPFYLATTSQYTDNAHIHLQDGGNAENTGIFSLLRRGYKTIVYVHGTEDNKAAWEGICHLKNQLELDGAYTLTSADDTGKEDWLRDVMKERNVAIQVNGHVYKNFLDGLCSSQLGDNDFSLFNLSPKTAGDNRINPVARIYCNRLDGWDITDKRTRREKVCPEYESRFSGWLSDKVDIKEEFVPICYPMENCRATDKEKDNAKARAEQAFWNWINDKPMIFTVKVRADEKDAKRSKEDASDLKVVSRIIAVVPTINAKDILSQLKSTDPKLPLPPDTRDESASKSWTRWCDASGDARRSVRIRNCEAPDGTWLSDGSSVQQDGLSCVALSHLIGSDCAGSADDHPVFPQNSFIKMTFSTSYPAYAAYFDLGRQQVRRALCKAGVVSCSARSGEVIASVR